MNRYHFADILVEPEPMQSNTAIPTPSPGQGQPNSSVKASTVLMIGVVILAVVVGILFIRKGKNSG